MADAGRGDGEPPTASPDPAPAQAPIDALAAEPALNDALSPPREFLLDTTTEQPRTEAVALTPVVAEQDETCVYVFGANVGAAPDAATAKLAKRVLQISVVLILLQAIIAVVYYVRDEPLALILITLCFSLAHPTCGIFGVMNKDRSLLCMFCGYGCIQCAADAITCVLCIVYAVSKSGKKRRDFAMLAAYYFVQGVIHYDLKPDNILIAGDGRAVISDFGVSQQVNRSDTMIGSPGTPTYTAPEVWGAGGYAGRLAADG